MANVVQPQQQRSGSPLPPSEEIPIRATNTDMNRAIISSIALGIVMFIIGYIVLKTVPYTDENYAHTLPPAHVNGQPVKPDQEALKPKGDVSHVGNQSVSGDTIVNGPGHL